MATAGELSLAPEFQRNHTLSAPHHLRVLRAFSKILQCCPGDNRLMTARATQVLKNACLRPGDQRGPLSCTEEG